MSICEDLDLISENVRVEMARARRSARYMQRTLEISRTRWNRRMTEPHSWTLGELCAIAEALAIPVGRLLKEEK